MNHQKWYFFLRGQAYAYGPIGPMTKDQAKNYIRKHWGSKGRMPYATQIWRERGRG